jgi:hypothetical protein
MILFAFQVSNRSHGGSASMGIDTLQMSLDSLADIASTTTATAAAPSSSSSSSTAVRTVRTGRDAVIPSKVQGPVKCKKQLVC